MKWKLFEEYDTGMSVGDGSMGGGGLMLMDTISHELGPGRATSGSLFLICPDNTSFIFSDFLAPQSGAHSRGASKCPSKPIPLDHWVTAW